MPIPYTWQHWTIEELEAREPVEDEEEDEMPEYLEPDPEPEEEEDEDEEEEDEDPAQTDLESIGRIIYNRQEQLQLTIPTSVAVVGCGGIGAWIAFNLGLVGVPKLILIDHDILEEHNLNRTPFKVDQIGQPKVQALAELLFERRLNISVYPIQKQNDQLAEFELQMLNGVEVIVDCRDVSDDTLPLSKQHICGSYDGYHVTLHLNPSGAKTWGGSDGVRARYQIAPSYLVPPQFIAALITLFLTSKEVQEQHSGETVKSFDIREIFAKL